ncbi:MAG: cell division protein FtsA, partial [Candidatus Caldarchaeum sp.]
MNTLFACVDLGCTKSAAVVVEAMNGGEARVLGFGQSQCRGLRKGIIVDLDEAARSLLAALRKAEQMANRRVDKIFVNTTGPDVSTQNTHGVVPIMPANRTITREDVHRALRHSRQVILPPDRCLLHATPRWFHLDGAERVSDPLGKTGVRLEVSTHLITTSSRQIENLEQCALKAQVEIEQIVFSGLASGMSVTTRTERAKRVAVVDMGA